MNTSSITEKFLEIFSGVYFSKISLFGIDIINWLKSKHFHRDENHATPHVESLYNHLIWTGELCAELNINKTFSWKYYLAGFLHDIGKPGTMKKLKRSFPSTNGKLKKLSMKGHGIVGAAMMDSWMFCEPAFKDAFDLTEDDMWDIAAVANYHMCGYFPQQMTSYHMNSFKACLRKEARELLCSLRKGDMESRKPSEPFNQVLQNVFTNEMQNDFNGWECDSTIDKNLGVLISIQGYSGNGKTTAALKIIEYLKNKFGMKKDTDVIHVNRDVIMLKMVATEILANEGKSVVNIPVSYGENQNNISYHDRVITYREAYNYYKNNKSRLSHPLNIKVNREINDALLAGRICIVDTMATLSTEIRKDIFPKLIKDCLKIFVWVHRDPKTFTNEECMVRRGVNIQDQNNVINIDYQDFKNPIGYNINWLEMSSLTEYGAAKLASKDIVKTFKPHFSLPIGFNSPLMWRSLYLLLDNVLIPKTNRLPLLKETLSTSLKDLVYQLVRDGGLEGMQLFFKEHKYITNLLRYDHCNIVTIAYIDGQNVWKPRWAREARGRAYAILKDEVKEIKKNLMRGAELLTSKHLSNNVNETQDIHRDVEHLDDAQKEIISKFDSPIPTLLKNCYVTEKVDGSLLVVSVYKRGTVEYNIMVEVINQTPNLWHVYVDNLLIVPATRCPIKISDDMKDYALTCIGAAVGISLSHVESLSINYIWENLIKNPFGLLIQSIVHSEQSNDKEEFYTNHDGLRQLNRDRIRSSNITSQSYESMLTNQTFNNNNEMVSLIFEMVCADRTTISKERHCELAVSYKKSDLYLLGMCIGDRYIPHYHFKCQTYKNIKLPLYRRVHNTSEVVEMLTDLDTVLTDQTTAAEYCQKWFNSASDTFHAEGFVLLQHDGDITTYTKIKHPLYYITHNMYKYLYKPLPPYLDKFYHKRTATATFPIIKNFIYVREKLPMEIINFLNSIMVKLFLKNIYENDNMFSVSPTFHEHRNNIFDKNRSYDSDGERIIQNYLDSYNLLCNFMLSNDRMKDEIVNFTREKFMNYLNSKTNDDNLYKAVKKLLLRYRPWLYNNYKFYNKEDLEKTKNAIIDDYKDNIIDFIDMFKSERKK